LYGLNTSFFLVCFQVFLNRVCIPMSLHLCVFQTQSEVKEGSKSHSNA
jgi:hypothetical protein